LRFFSNRNREIDRKNWYARTKDRSSKERGSGIKTARRGGYRIAGKKPEARKNGERGTLFPRTLRRGKEDFRERAFSVHEYAYTITRRLLSDSIAVNEGVYGFSRSVRG